LLARSVKSIDIGYRRFVYEKQPRSGGFRGAGGDPPPSKISSIGKIIFRVINYLIFHVT
jgi:hypothetical protein